MSNAQKQHMGVIVRSDTSVSPFNFVAMNNGSLIISLGEPVRYVFSTTTSSSSMPLVTNEATTNAEARAKVAGWCITTQIAPGNTGRISWAGRITVARVTNGAGVTVTPGDWLCMHQTLPGIARVTDTAGNKMAFAIADNRITGGGVSKQSRITVWTVPWRI